MKKVILKLIIIVCFISCSEQEQTETELKPIINLSIEPNIEVIPYGSDVFLNWNITNATSASMNGEPINLSGNREYLNFNENKEIEIFAKNIVQTETLTRHIRVSEKPKAPLYYKFAFNMDKLYFATDGSMDVPITKREAQISEHLEKIDLTFIYENSWSDPGFMDPIARSKSYYGWEHYYEPWLDGSIETVFYSKEFSANQFELAKQDQSKIDEYFNLTEMKPTESYISPDGCYIGSRRSKTTLKKDKAYGFENKVSGKRGLIYISKNQGYSWPNAIETTDTNVEIIREQ